MAITEYMYNINNNKPPTLSKAGIVCTKASKIMAILFKFLINLNILAILIDLITVEASAPVFLNPSEKTKAVIETITTTKSN